MVKRRHHMEHIGGLRGASDKVKPVSEGYKHCKINLLGHVIRAGDTDPMRKVTFMPNTMKEWGTAGGRLGRPKDQWLQDAKKYPSKEP